MACLVWKTIYVFICTNVCTYMVDACPILKALSLINYPHALKTEWQMIISFYNVLIERKQFKKEKEICIPSWKINIIFKLHMSKEPLPSRNKPERVYEKTKSSLFLFPNQAYFFSNIKTFFLVLIKTKMHAGLTINSDVSKTFVLMKLSIWRGLNFRECFQSLLYYMLASRLLNLLSSVRTV